MTALLFMQRLAATKSRADKEQIIFDAFMTQCTEFFVGARLALDPLVTFGVTKVAEIVEDDDEPGRFSFAEFVELANSLWRRHLTGNRARETINAAAECCHVATWNQFYRRILLKDFAVEAKAINKVLHKVMAAHPNARDHVIPIFACQLAHDAAKHANKVRGCKLVDAKVEGVRLIIVLDQQSKVVSLFTDKGQVVEHFTDLRLALEGLLIQLPGSVVLDGILRWPQGEQHLMTLIRRKEAHADMVRAQYAAFDILPLSDFRTGRCAIPQRERHALLETMQECGLWKTTHGRVRVLPQVAVDLDTAKGRAALTEFQQRVIAAGHEGVMVKDPDAVYENKRSTAWLKLT